MTARTIRLLYIEDDPAQRRFMAHHLATMDEFRFEIRCVESEADAGVAFREGGIDLVLLDYHLSQGDGLSCLQTLRGLDAIVPVIAISGVATPEIAAELLQTGADDYIAKQDLTGALLARSVRDVLARADAWRRRAAV